MTNRDLLSVPIKFVLPIQTEARMWVAEGARYVAATTSCINFDDILLKYFSKTHSFLYIMYLHIEFGQI